MIPQTSYLRNIKQKRKIQYACFPACRTRQVDTSNEKKKPELILFYNANKVGVDCFDQMACLCITRSASRRWPVAVWNNSLDIAAINSYLLYKRATSNRITRRQFILMLVENLLGKPKPCLNNSNRQLRGDDEEVQKWRKCHGVCCDKTV